VSGLCKIYCLSIDADEEIKENKIKGYKRNDLKN